MAELETDVQQLQGQLERQQVQLREADRDKTRAVSELSEQNHRLLEQLSRVSGGEGGGVPPSCLGLHLHLTDTNSSTSKGRSGASGC